MESERPYRTTSTNSSSNSSTTSELFICFTSRLSSSSSMKLSSKSILSPGRTREPSQISLSSSLSRRLRSNGSMKGGQASPMFPTGAKKRGCAFENPEPSSPKVTCIGQVRVKTKKQGKKLRTRSKRRGEASFRRVEQQNTSLNVTQQEVNVQNNSQFQSQQLLQQQQQQQQQQHHTSKLLTLPTVLTLGRVAAVPLLISTFYVDSWWGTTATTSIFIAAAVTDWLDGYLARKMRLGSAFGAFLDPVADKLMVAATLVLLCSRPLEVAMFEQVPWFLTAPSIAIIGREITMSAVREWAASQNSKLLEAVAVNNLGKWKTATQMTALTILLATRDCSLGGPGILVASGVVLLYISAGLALWSLVVYMRKIWRVLLR